MREGVARIGRMSGNELHAERRPEGEVLSQERKGRISPDWGIRLRHSYAFA